MLKNSTNIPDQLIAIAVAFAMPPGCDGLVSCITVKNKRRGKIRGSWGWHYPNDNRVVIIVPRKISRTHTVRRKYSRKLIGIRSRADFLVMIMAHELRHAWQHKHWDTDQSRWKLRRDRVSKYAQEVDAEMYEAEVLARWQAMTPA